MGGAGQPSPEGVRPALVGDCQLPGRVRTGVHTVRHQGLGADHEPAVVLTLALRLHPSDRVVAAALTRVTPVIHRLD